MADTEPRHPRTSAKDCSIFMFGRDGFNQVIEYYNLPTLEDLSKSYRFLTKVTSLAAGAGGGLAVGVVPFMKDALTRGDYQSAAISGIGMVASLALSTAHFYIMNGSHEAYTMIQNRIQRRVGSLSGVNS